MTHSPWKEIENNRNTIQYLNESLKSLPSLVVASRFEPSLCDKRESWWAIDYYVGGEPQGSILDSQDNEFLDRFGMTLPLVVKGKKNAIKAINNFINPKRYRFGILTHQHIPKGFSTDNPEEAKELLKRAREFDKNAVIIDSRDFYATSE